MSLAQLTTYSSRAVSRLLNQYRSLPLFSALIGELGTTVQAVEDAIWALMAKTAIATADGVWLDRLGAIIGQARDDANGVVMTDAELRRLIAARILALRSLTTIESLISMLTAWNSGVDPIETIVNSSPAGIEITIADPVLFPALAEGVANPELLRLRALLRASRAGGVALMLRYQDTTDAHTLFFATGTAPEASVDQGLDDAAAPGAGGRPGGAIRC